MKLSTVLSVSLFAQLTLYAYTIYWMYDNRSSTNNFMGDFNSSILYMFLVVCLGLLNIGLFIAYCIKNTKQKQPVSFWIIGAMIVMLIAIIFAPAVMERADRYCTDSYMETYGHCPDR